MVPESSGGKWYRKACGDMVAGKSRRTNGSFDCDSNSANDADIDEDIDDGGKEQRKQMQQQHSSAALKTNQQYPPTKVTNVARATV